MIASGVEKTFTSTFLRHQIAFQPPFTYIAHRHVVSFESRSSPISRTELIHFASFSFLSLPHIHSRLFERPINQVPTSTTRHHSTTMLRPRCTSSNNIIEAPYLSLSRIHTQPTSLDIQDRSAYFKKSVFVIRQIFPQQYFLQDFHRRPRTLTIFNMTDASSSSQDQSQQTGVQRPMPSSQVSAETSNSEQASSHEQETLGIF